MEWRDYTPLEIAAACLAGAAIFAATLYFGSLPGLPLEGKPLTGFLHFVVDVIGGGTAGAIVIGAILPAAILNQLRKRRVARKAKAADDAAAAEMAAAPPRRRAFIMPVEGTTADEDEHEKAQTKGQIAILLGAEEGSPEAEDARPADTDDYAALLTGIVEANAPPPPHDGPLPSDILTARAHAIVLRELYPPKPGAGLSFYGGLPVTFEGFPWPRGADGRPLHFMMQWDCTDLAAIDPTGLFPKSGALYFFLDFRWGKDDGFRFLHVPGPGDGWVQILPPEDLGPVHEDQGAWQMAGCTAKVDDPDRFVPRLMPHFPFAPVLVDVPAPQTDDPQERWFWGGGEEIAERLLAAQDSLGDPLWTHRPDEKLLPFERPFESFPHDFGAIRVLAAKAIDELTSFGLTRRPGTLPDLTDEEKAAQLSEWLEQAKELYLFAAHQWPTSRVDPELSLQVWEWVEQLEPVFRLNLRNATLDSVNLSLGNGSDALDDIPQEWIDRNSLGHAIAHAYDRLEHPDWSVPDAAKVYEERKAAGELAIVRQVFAPAPPRMLGPASYVQGYVEDLVDDHILLLELSSRDALGHHFGEGVLQYLIRPADLAARKFGEVKAVISAY